MAVEYGMLALLDATGTPRPAKRRAGQKGDRERHSRARIAFNSLKRATRRATQRRIRATHT